MTLELVTHAVAQAAASGPEARTGAADLLAEFQLDKLYKLTVQRPSSKNHLALPAKAGPATGLAGDTTLYSHPAWSLLRQRPAAVDESAAAEPSLERVRRAFRLGPGGCSLTQADKGTDVTHVFLRNTPAAPARQAAPAGESSLGGTATVPVAAAAGSKRRAGDAAGGGTQVSGGGDTNSLSASHESKRQRNY